MWKALLFALALVSAHPALAVQPDEILSDPALEARARHLSKDLRCMVCQNQSIDDSDAGLARDLRLLVRERLKEGDSDSQVIDYLVTRYGEFVLLKPRFEKQTLLLWLTPLFVLVIGGFALFKLARRRDGAPAVAGGPRLSAEEKKRLDELTGPNGR